jgi:hypothetical protein
VIRRRRAQSPQRLVVPLRPIIDAEPRAERSTRAQRSTQARVIFPRPNMTGVLLLDRRRARSASVGDP